MKVKKLKNMEKLKFNVLAVVAACKDFFHVLERSLARIEERTRVAACSLCKCIDRIAENFFINASILIRCRYAEIGVQLKMKNIIECFMCSLEQLQNNELYTKIKVRTFL